MARSARPPRPSSSMPDAAAPMAPGGGSGGCAAARQDSYQLGVDSGRERSAVQGSMAARTVIRAVGIVVAMTFREATWSM